ncbi:MAG: RNB domain-containing ribonuclease [Treponema sp.]|nr:RNB domain-containing ribonuclease [Treponema sp.]
MVHVQSPVVYKNSAAIVTSAPDNGKFSIKFQSAPATPSKGASYSTQSVRAKDVLCLAEGEASSLEDMLRFAEESAPKAEDIYDPETALKNPLACRVKEAWELLVSDDGTAREPVDFKDLVSLFYGNLTATESWGLFLALKNTVYFSQSLKEQTEGRIVFVPRSEDEINELQRKADEKGNEARLRAEFLERLKNKSLILPDDGKFMGDVEALALGKTDRSRTMHDARIKETPERAHRLLLDTGLWAVTRNPYPVRWGLSMQSASENLSSPPDEERTSVPGISYAIDNEWSADPDDAVAFDGEYLWVHIADPASTVMPDSSIDKAARERGATLYLPEGASRMLCEDSLEDYALGLTEKSRALSFRIRLSEDGSVQDCDVMKTLVNVRRLTYQEATALKDTPEFLPLFKIAGRNMERRNRSGAVQIDIPEVHIKVEPETRKVMIEPDIHPAAADMVREMMLLAGEGAAKFAFKNGIPFPFVSQEAPAIPEELPDGLARQFRLRRCMRRRTVGVTPSMHCGLGINMYSQVTSPLRRYGDLIAHQQLRAFLDGRKLLDKDEVLMRVSQGDAAAVAARNAERKSTLHWTLVYLLQNPDWTGDAVCVDKSGRVPQWFIPGLGLETFFAPSSDVPLNGVTRVKAGSINLPELQVDFMQTDL